MKVVAFLSEPFYKVESGYASSKSSYNFIEACFEYPTEIMVASGIANGDCVSSSVVIGCDNFLEVPFYSSFVDFIKKSLFKPTFFYNYIKSCNHIIENNPEALLWVRNPSIGCVIFSLCAIKKKRKIYNHMCANAMNAWKNDKYKGAKIIFAWLSAKVLEHFIKKVCMSDYTVNLCTGSELHNYCLNLNSRSYQLIDSTALLSESFYPNNDISSKIRFLFIGRVQKDKGIDRLLADFSIINIQKDATLTVIGDGELLPSLKNKYTEHNNISFHGSVDNKVLSKYLSEADVVVVPSNNAYEGFPRVILEAWSFGLPVIVSNVGGVTAFVKDEFNGILFDFEDKQGLINALGEISDTDKYMKLQHGALESRYVASMMYWVDIFKKIRTEA